MVIPLKTNLPLTDCQIANLVALIFLVDKSNLLLFVKELACPVPDRSEYF